MRNYGSIAITDLPSTITDETTNLYVIQVRALNGTDDWFDYASIKDTADLGNAKHLLRTEGDKYRVWGPIPDVQSGLRCDWTEEEVPPHGVRCWVGRVIEVASGLVLLERRQYHINEHERRLTGRAMIAEVINEPFMKRTFPVPVQVRVTCQDLCDVMAAFMDAGQPWVACVQVRQHESEGRAQYASDVVPLGGQVNIQEHDGETAGPWHILTREKLLEGLRRAAEEGHVNLGDSDWVCDVDCNKASAIVELALFGEVRYC